MLAPAVPRLLSPPAFAQYSRPRIAGRNTAGSRSREGKRYLRSHCGCPQPVRFAVGCLAFPSGDGSLPAARASPERLARTRRGPNRENAKSRNRNGAKPGKRNSKAFPTEWWQRAFSRRARQRQPSAARARGGTEGPAVRRRPRRSRIDNTAMAASASNGLHGNVPARRVSPSERRSPRPQCDKCLGNKRFSPALTMRPGFGNLSCSDGGSADQS